MEKLKEIGNQKVCPVIAILRGKKMLVGLRNYTPDKWKTVSVWTIPGGRCDEGESIEATLRREVKEEVGIASLEVKDFLGEVEGAKDGDTVCVFSGTSDEEPKLLEPEKFSEWKWVELDEIKDFINPKVLGLIKADLESKS
jgi:ADP-ribose pyrophosphatase YjhB (NUDIX family)